MPRFLMRELADKGWPRYWITLDGKIWSERIPGEPGEWITPYRRKDRKLDYIQLYLRGQKTEKSVASLIAEILHEREQVYCLAIGPQVRLGVGQCRRLDPKGPIADFRNLVKCPPDDLPMVRYFWLSGLLRLPADEARDDPGSFGFERREADLPHY